MAQPVWVLSVDLQTRTATFQSGMADAAKSARASFKEIKESANEMSDGVSGAARSTEYSMTEARHGVMMLGEEFGVHLPRGLTTFIASLGPVGAAMEAAFPFLAIILGATLLIEHLTKLHEEADKLADSQTNMGTSIQGVFSKLDDKLLEVGIRADELTGNHLAALRKQLELIDHQEMKSLIDEFGTLDKISSAVLTQLKAHWYQLGSGSEGAIHALDAFKIKYESLLSQGKSKEAGDLLAGTLASAEKVLALQKQAMDNQGQSGGKHGDYQKYEQASLQLKQMGIGFTEREVEAQQTLTDALRAQTTVAEKLSAIGHGEKKNDIAAEAKKEEEEQQKAAEVQQRGFDRRFQIEAEYYKKSQATAKKAAAEKAADIELEAKAYQGVLQSILEADKEKARIGEELGKEEAEHSKKMAALIAQAAQEQTKEAVKIKKAHSQEILAEELAAEKAEFDAQMNALKTELGTLDQYGKEREVKLKQIQDKEIELTQAHENKVAALKGQAQVELDKKIADANAKMRDLLASNFTSVLTSHQTFAKMMTGLGDQIASGMIENALKSIMALNLTKEHEAAAAARKMYLTGAAFPPPTNIVMAPLLGATAFAAMMAFAEGGIVPGVGRGDTVPAMLTPGESVLPRPLTEGLTNAAKNGSLGGGDTHVVHVHMTNHVNTIDGDGMQRTLEKHADVVEKHVNNAIRKRNM